MSAKEEQHRILIEMKDMVERFLEVDAEMTPVDMDVLSRGLNNHLRDLENEIDLEGFMDKMKEELE